MRTPTTSGGGSYSPPRGVLRVPERQTGVPRSQTHAFQEDLDSDDDVGPSRILMPGGGSRGVVTPARSAIAIPVAVPARSSKTTSEQLQTRETLSSDSPRGNSDSRAPSNAVAGAARLGLSEVVSASPQQPPAVVVVESEPSVEDDLDKPNNWTTSLFGDACIDTALAFEVCLCHPCNVAAQYEAALRKTPEPPEEEVRDSDESSSTEFSEEEKPQQKLVRRKGSRPRDDSSSDSSEDDNVKIDMNQLREALPPLDIIPCVGVIVLDVMCWGAGSAYFTYWIRNEVARRFNIIPDAAEQIKANIQRAKELKEKAKEQSKKIKSKLKDFKAEVSEGIDDGKPKANSAEEEEYEYDEEAEEEEVYNEEAEEGEEAEEDPEEFSYAPQTEEKETFFSKLRRRMQPKLEIMKRGAAKIGKAAQKQAKKTAAKTGKFVAERAEKATYVSADYAQSSLASCFCFPCALCQTHRELEKHGLPPTRYLSATRLAAAYATGTLAGNSKLAKRML